MDFRNRGGTEIVACPRCRNLRTDRRFQRPRVRLKNILPDRALRPAAAQPLTVRRACKLTDQRAVNRFARIVEQPEIDIALGIRRLKQRDIRRIGDDSAAGGTELPDHLMQFYKLLLPCLPVDFRKHERHAVTFHERKQILDREILEHMQPCKRADQPRPRRVLFFLETVDHKLVRRQLHAVRELVANEARNKTFPQREMPCVHGFETAETAARRPDDFSRRKRGNHRVRQIADEVIKRIITIEFAALGKLRGKCFRGCLVDLLRPARHDIPFDAADRVRPLFHRADDVPVALHDFACANGKLFDVAGVRGAHD